MAQLQRNKGSVIAYILVAIFLMGMLIMSITNGPQKNPRAAQLDQTGLGIDADIGIIESAIRDCVLTYSKAVDWNGDGTINSTDNPNPPYPLYNAAPWHGGTTGVDITNIICPGAPGGAPAGAATGRQIIFNKSPGRILRVLKDTSTYSVKYFNTIPDGIKIVIGRTSTDSLWTETISRLDAKYSANKASVSSGAGDCTNGCLNYNVKISTAGPSDCPLPGDVCTDGTIFAGFSPDGTTIMYTTRCDVGMSWSGAACTGTRTALAFNNAGTNPGDYVSTGYTSTTTGKSNSAGLATFVGGGTPYQAAQACEGLTSNGKSDWYLPAADEFSVMYASRDAIGNFDTASGHHYWSSTELAASQGFLCKMTDPGVGFTFGKPYQFYARCVRR